MRLELEQSRQKLNMNTKSP
jgi:hypothetical protein